MTPVTYAVCFLVLLCCPVFLERSSWDMWELVSTSVTVPVLSSALALPSVLETGWKTREASDPVVWIMPLWSSNRISHSWDLVAKTSSFERNLLLVLFMALYVELKDNIFILKNLLAHCPLYWPYCKAGKERSYCNFTSLEAGKTTSQSLVPLLFFSKLRKRKMEIH